MRHRYETKSEPTERVFEDGPLAPEVTRSRLPSPSPCCDGCKGWEVFDSDKYGLHLAVCDECWEGIPDDRRVYDDDIAELPEAKAALVAQVEQDGPGELEGWPAICYAEAKGRTVHKRSDHVSGPLKHVPLEMARKHLKRIDTEAESIWIEVAP